MTLESIDTEGNFYYSDYFVLIGNNHRYTATQNLVWGDNNQNNEIIRLLKTLSSDLEQKELNPSSYKPYKDQLQRISLLKRYPVVKKIPFTANRLLALLSEKEGKYRKASEYLHNNLKQRFSQTL